MADAAQGGGSFQDDSKAMEADVLASVNNVTYELEPAVSVATSRTQKEYLATNQKHYMGRDPIHIDITSGNTFADLKNSYLSYDVHFENVGGDLIKDTRIPQGASWVNMFDFFKITHASGVEVDRQNSALGVWRQIKQQFDRSKEWRDTVGSGLLGLASTDKRPFDNVDERKGDMITEENERDAGARKVGDMYHGNRALEGYTAHVVIPLNELFDWADKDELAPPYLISGLRIDLKTLRKEAFFIRQNDYKTYTGTPEDPAAGLYDLAPGAIGDVPAWDMKPWAEGSGVYLDNIKMSLCSYSLTDSMARRISEISAAQGLQWSWTGVAHIATTNASEDFTMQISQALSRANSLIVKARLDSRLNRHDANHFASLPWIKDDFDRDKAKRVDSAIGGEIIDQPTYDIDGTCLSMQARIGAMYLPAQPLSGGIKKFYQSALQTFGAFRRNDAQVGPTLGEFGGALMTPGQAYQTVATAGDTDYFPAAAFAETEGFLPAITKGAQGVYAIPLESSPNLKQSGIAISAQRTAEINFRFRPMSGLNRLRRYDMFIPHTKLATLFLGEVCVVRS